jgi:hypothetical protein
MQRRENQQEFRCRPAERAIKIIYLVAIPLSLFIKIEVGPLDIRLAYIASCCVKSGTETTFQGV